jgi:hypothetical protein
MQQATENTTCMTPPSPPHTWDRSPSHRWGSILRPLGWL